MASGTFMQQPVLMIAVFAVLSLAPFLLITATSFVKLTAVLSILRSALGTPQIPPNVVVTGLSLALSMVIMMPVVTEIQNRFEQNAVTWQTLLESSDPAESVHVVIGCVLPPVTAFLKRHVHERELHMIRGMAWERDTEHSDDDSVIVLIAAFILSELKEAFQIGFLLFLPFLVIDMIIANILQALGMVMLSPTTVSLPFKLLLFVLSDGWFLVVEGLLAGYV